MTLLIFLSIILLILLLFCVCEQELHSQWALWQPVLSDAAGATHAGGGGSGISVHPYGRGSLMDL